MAINDFKVAACSFRDLLTSQKPIFGVPDYQRRYEWDKQQVDELWKDIFEALTNHENQEYFVGTVVLYPDSKDSRRRLIIDGQQRIATLTVFLAALRDQLEQLNETAKAEDIHQNIIRKPLSGNEEYIVELRDSDREYLRDCIQNKSSKRPISKKKRKGVRGRPPRNYLKGAYDYICDEIQNQIQGKSATGKVDRLIQLAEFIRDKVTFITTLVASEIDAYIVFETLNHRGLDLSIADLVKNYLFSIAQKHNRLPDMQRYWEQIESSLKGLGEKAFSKFLRCYWLSKYKRITQKELFDSIKSHLKGKNRDGLFKFASELQENAEIYYALNQPEAKDPNVWDLLDLKDMGIQQHLPLLLAAKDKGISDSDFGTLVAICEKVTMRYLIVGDKNPNELETKYSEWAIRLRHKDTDDSKIILAIQNEAAALCPKNPDFEAGFQGLTDLNTATARYILRKINEHVTGTKMELKPPVEVHVEHILPITPSDDWKQAFPDKNRALECSKQLGNLTLLNERLNKIIKNRGFDFKKPKYAESGIKITTDLCEKSEWTAETIMGRQKYFSESASKVWS